MCLVTPIFSDASSCERLAFTRAALSVIFNLSKHLTSRLKLY
nr:MAG TPA: hypothetical protein [Caudoviricetes sp.]